MSEAAAEAPIELVRIWPDEEDFDTSDDTIVEGVTKAAGWQFWTHQHLMKEDENAAETWLLSEILRVNGKVVTPLDVETAPWMTGDCYTACLAHIADRLNPWHKPNKGIKGEPTPHGEQVYELDNGTAIVAVELKRQELSEYRRKSQKDPLNAQKWAIVQAFRLVPPNGEPTAISKSDFPRFNGSTCSGGNPNFTWDCWSLLTAFFFKRWFSHFLTS